MPSISTVETKCNNCGRWSCHDHVPRSLSDDWTLCLHQLIGKLTIVVCVFVADDVYVDVVVVDDVDVVVVDVIVYFYVVNVAVDVVVYVLVAVVNVVCLCCCLCLHCCCC